MDLPFDFYRTGWNKKHIELYYRIKIPCLYMSNSVSIFHFNVVKGNHILFISVADGFKCRIFTFDGFAIY